MNRAMRRASAANGRKLQKKDWNEFQDVTAEALYRHRLLNPGSTYRPDRVYQNNKFIVQVFDNKQILGMNATKAMIRRADSGTEVFWADLQRIKNEIWGLEAQAIQMFPKESELVDDANLYWIWVIR